MRGKLDNQPDPVDIAVGIRVRERRRQLGQSQEALGEAIGVSFQQTQKYERGANRVSASMLVRIARSQGVPVAWYFEGLDAATPAPTEHLERDRWLTGAAADRLVLAAMALPPAVLTALADLAQRIGPKVRA